MMHGKKRAMSFFFSSLFIIKRETDDTRNYFITDGTTNWHRRRERETERERKEMLLAAIFRYALSDTSLSLLHTLTFVYNHIQVRAFLFFKKKKRNVAELIDSIEIY